MRTKTSASGRVTRTSSPCQRGGAAGPSGSPDRGGRRRETEEPRGRVELDSRPSQARRIERGEIGEAGGVGVCGVVRFDPCVLEPRDVGEIGEPEFFARPGDEVGKALAIGDQHRRARLFAPGHRRAPAPGTPVRRECAASRDSAPRSRRSARPRHCCDRPRSGVRRARLCGRAWRRAAARRDRGEPRRNRRSSPQTAWAGSTLRAGAAVIARSARRASASSAGHAGRSLSHSMRVGFGPSFRIASA